MLRINHTPSGTLDLTHSILLSWAAYFPLLPGSMAAVHQTQHLSHIWELCRVIQTSMLSPAAVCHPKPLQMQRFLSPLPYRLFVVIHILLLYITLNHLLGWYFSCFAGTLFIYFLLTILDHTSPPLPLSPVFNMLLFPRMRSIAVFCRVESSPDEFCFFLS